MDDLSEEDIRYEQDCLREIDKHLTRASANASILTGRRADQIRANIAAARVLAEAEQHEQRFTSRKRSLESLQATA